MTASKRASPRSLGSDLAKVAAHVIQSRSVPRLYGEMPPQLKGKRVLLVDDVASSGDTLELAKTLAGQIGAKRTETASFQN